jgi:hypothetical protein
MSLNLSNYYLNFKSIEILDKDDKSRIHEYYRDMIYANSDGRKDVAMAIFNTLVTNGYLISSREDKIDNILNGDSSVNN